MEHPEITEFDFARGAEEILAAFDIKKSIYPDPGGDWRDDPSTLDQCASHEILYQCLQLDASKRIICFQDIRSCLRSIFALTELEKIRQALDVGMESAQDVQYKPDHTKADAFLVIFRILTWSLAAEALHINSRRCIPEWNQAAKAECRDYELRLKRLNALAAKHLSTGSQDALLTDLFTRLLPSLPEAFKSIPALLAEEDRLTLVIERLLAKAKDPAAAEEAYALIIQRLHPPTGVVTEISPAFLRPCQRLLTDDSLDVASGIPYTASVILSVLQDTRSTETLLLALDRFPVRYTKIRENLLYTLGNLKESRAVQAIAQVLNEPDTLASSSEEKVTWAANLTEQKIEAIQALGRIGLPSLQVLSTLLECGSHPSNALTTHLAWALGEIGKAQKNRLGGISTDIIIALLKLLGLKNKDSFIESVSALKKMGCPEFLHSLHLYDIGAVSILGIKPAQKGLYELSETLHHLISTKGRAVIMAVNGDSGTGKTYYCEAIKDGFGAIKAEEVLYLMRDRKKDQAIFNRILGLEWLKRHIDPVYYQNYPVSAEADDPEEYFHRFMEEQADRKLIILDGCRDRHYFQSVIDRFHLKGLLDVDVNFRAAYSTRRENLEEREIALESVKTHLAFLEEPALEDTRFYQQGNVLIYDLDNSIPNRLNHEEVRELFRKPRVERWGDLIRLGELADTAPTQKIASKTQMVEQSEFSWEPEKMPDTDCYAFLAEERKFQLQLNQDHVNHPNLLGHIDMSDLKAKHLRFYAQEQIAGWGESGDVFVMTFVDHRIFYMQAGPCQAMSLLGRDIFVIDDQGKMLSISFEKGKTSVFNTSFSPITCLDSLPLERIVTGHVDGSIRVWDSHQQQLRRIEAHKKSLQDIAIDPWGRIYTLSSDSVLKRWDLANNKVFTIRGFKNIDHIKPYPDAKLLAANDTLHILDFELGISTSLYPLESSHVADFAVNEQGKIIASLTNSLAVFSPNEEHYERKLLEGHRMETYSCLIMGPKILTCGKESEEFYDIRLSGNEFFVKHEFNRQSLQI